MARKKTRTTTPLPPRDGLGASRIRVPDTGSERAFDLLERVVATQRHRHPDDTSDAVRARFAAGEVVYRDGTDVSPDAILEPGTDIFFYRRPAPERPVPHEITIVHEDDDILVVDKPPFLATMPRAAHITETATVRLRRATGNEELTPAHRLDRATSGLLLFTKRREIRGPYQELFAQREVDKVYEAIASLVDVSVPTSWHHHLTKEHGELATVHRPDLPPNSHTEVVAVEPLPAEDAARLRARYGVAGELARYTLHPITGRTHQLRVQMMLEAAPILGDRIYPTPLPAETEDFSTPMLLRCVRLGFTDPLTGAPRSFEC